MTYRLLPVSAAISEFQGFTGDCGQAATLAALHVLKGNALTGAELDSIVNSQIAAHLADPNGPQTSGDIVTYLKGLGLEVFTSGFENPLQFNWHQYLLDNAGDFPIILEVANSGAGFGNVGDEAGVHFHFICVLGIQDSGYMVADGDNVAARSGQLVTYSYDQIAAAQPVAVIGVQKSAPSPTVHIPTGWKDDGATLTAPNGHTMAHGFRAYVLADATHSPSDMPTGEEYSDGSGGTFQNMAGYRLHWDAKTGAISKVALPTPEPPQPPKEPPVPPTVPPTTGPTAQSEKTERDTDLSSLADALENLLGVIVKMRSQA